MKKEFSKYHAKKVVVDGIEFQSKKEANRYCELKLLQRAGKISDLKLQVPFVLIPTQYEEIITYTPKRQKEKKIKKVVEKMAQYIADFTYYDENGNYIVEDTKGYRDSVSYAYFVLKRKLMLWVHNIKIVEV